jgi:Zn-dependent protease
MSMPLNLVVVQVMALLTAITVHEMMHGWAAHRLGDPTARLHGRLTINPLAHIDLFGTIILPLILIATKSPVLIGWAKPVPVNATYFRNPRRGMAVVSVAGPLSNLALAIVAAFLLKVLLLAPGSAHVILDPGTAGVMAPLVWFAFFSVQINVLLAVFNMVPIPPLDGGHFLEGVLPVEMARGLSRIEPYGMVIIFALLWLGFLDRFLVPIQSVITGLLLR